LSTAFNDPGPHAECLEIGKMVTVHNNECVRICTRRVPPVRDRCKANEAGRQGSMQAAGWEAEWGRRETGKEAGEWGGGTRRAEELTGEPADLGRAKGCAKS
jgi:hypothetical protein